MSGWDRLRGKLNTPETIVRGRRIEVMSDVFLPLAVQEWLCEAMAPGVVVVDVIDPAGLCLLAVGVSYGEGATRLRHAMAGKPPQSVEAQWAFALKCAESLRAWLKKSGVTLVKETMPETP